MFRIAVVTQLRPDSFACGDHAVTRDSGDLRLRLKQYRKRDVCAGTEPFAGPIRMRDKRVYATLPDLRVSAV